MLLITGATGNTGSALVEQCDRHHIKYSVASSRKLEGYRHLDFNKPETFSEALSGITTVFLVRPPAMANIDKQFKPFIEYLSSTDVKNIIFLSILGAEKRSFVPHRKIEKLIEQSNLNYAFLRASFFMQNLTTTHQVELEQENKLYLPAGNGKTSFVDVEDIAKAVVSILKRPSTKAAYDLTGSEALDYYEVAETLSKALGRPITYESVSPLSFFLRWLKNTRSFMQALVMTVIYTVARSGNAARISDDLKHLLKDDPTTMKEFAHRFAHEDKSLTA